jgi:hypothetical protein
VLRYAHEHGCKWSTGTCSQAAAGRYLEVLRYAHENGCPWDSRTCLRAAAGGHLEALTYAHEHGCLLQQYPCRTAAMANGHTEVVEYLHTITLAAWSAAARRCARKMHIRVRHQMHALSALAGVARATGAAGRLAQAYCRLSALQPPPQAGATAVRSRTHSSSLRPPLRPSRLGAKLTIASNYIQLTSNTLR